MSSFLRTLDLRRCGWLLLGQAALLAACVMPRVAADTDAMGSPHRALPALGALAAFFVLCGAVLWAMDGVPARADGRRRGTLALLLALITLAGISLADAGAAYLGHGAPMRVVSAALFACVLVDLVVAIALVERLRARRGSEDAGLR